MTTTDRRTLLTETVLVLGVSLGASAVWSLLSLVRKLTAEAPLSAQTTSMNTSRVPDRPWLDLAYQLADVTLALVPVLLALHLLARDPGPPAPGTLVTPGTLVPPGGAAHAVGPPHRLMGLDLTRPARDLLHGTALAAAIGIPGLGLYLGARALDLSTTIAPANLPQVWWAVPVLILASVQNALLEEVVMVGYLFRRWSQAGWSTAMVVVTSALVRGTYHAYQGFGGFVGNVAMGLLLGWVYTRTRRVMPLVVAHTLLDVVAFVGYAVLADRVGWL
ncbi:CAAX protease [Ornithinimicrobium sp. CNJ-824]|uniref:CPBP family intramembrane glutamic endopeptidase n=1 Tax=Ornithinimicrobium sp. CNJ-824 TaxID=1904966 RepID=UPI0009594213|nr:CPBP family intramembrane glutamic endopeptidase [Ornithinimicrobium sp. CNJ-824]OLT21819.1 CAAX protease [Ornithinimicrobium sp. CNJ-824]